MKSETTAISQETDRNRCALLDFLRGMTVISMVIYHACWDLVWIFGQDWAWYKGQAAYFWQQSICCTFILLSGFCAGMSRSPARRGGLILGISILVSLVTILFMPENRIICGVLTCIGSCMLLVSCLRNALKGFPAAAGMLLSLLCFCLTRHVQNSFLGFLQHAFLTLPDSLYQNYFTAYLGFPQPDFWSTDYFPVIPWVFLFLTGFFLYQLCGRYILCISWKGFPPVNAIGRHALELYILHQPVIYGILYLSHMLHIL